MVIYFKFHQNRSRGLRDIGGRNLRLPLTWPLACTTALHYRASRDSIANVSWNGILSKNFPVKNGVRQGGIVSPVLFCIYIDGLLCAILWQAELTFIHN